MHTIRLRGPWQLEPFERFVAGPDGDYAIETVSCPQPARAVMPADWSSSLGSEFSGRVRYRRTFQKPTNLDPGERVWLVVEPPRTVGAILLGGKLLGSVRQGAPAARVDITDLLSDRNMLQIEITHPAIDDHGRRVDLDSAHTPGGLVGEVRLEIERSE